MTWPRRRPTDRRRLLRNERTERGLLLLGRKVSGGRCHAWWWWWWRRRRRCLRAQRDRCPRSQSGAAAAGYHAGDSRRETRVGVGGGLGLGVGSAAAAGSASSPPPPPPLPRPRADATVPADSSSRSAETKRPATPRARYVTASPPAGQPPPNRTCHRSPAWDGLEEGRRFVRLVRLVRQHCSNKPRGLLQEWVNMSTTRCRVNIPLQHKLGMYR